MSAIIKLALFIRVNMHMTERGIKRKVGRVNVSSQPTTKFILLLCLNSPPSP